MNQNIPENEIEAKQALIEEFHYTEEYFKELEEDGVSCMERLAFEREGDEIIDRMESESEYGQEVLEYLRDMNR